MVVTRLELEISIKVDPDPFPVLDYTAKLSKSILIKMNPALQQVFKRKRGGPPKPVAITPPLEPGSLRPLAPLIESMRKPAPEEFRPVLLSSGRILVHLALPNTLLRMLPPPGSRTALKYRGATVRAVLDDARIIAQAPPPEIVYDTTIATITPYLPKDPYIHSKYSSFNLAPDTTLSVPAYIATRILGRSRSLARTLATLRRCLILPHTGYCRMRKTWYLTRTREGVLRPVPALTGSLQYRINTYDCSEQDRLLTLQVLQVGRVTGIGKSRAAGLGSLRPI